MLVSTPNGSAQAAFTNSANTRSRISSLVGSASSPGICASARSKPARLTIPTGGLQSSTGTRLMRWRAISRTISSRGALARDPSRSHQDFEPSRAVPLGSGLAAAEQIGLRSGRRHAARPNPSSADRRYGCRASAEWPRQRACRARPGGCFGSDLRGVHGASPALGEICRAAILAAMS